MLTIKLRNAYYFGVDGKCNLFVAEASQEAFCAIGAEMATGGATHRVFKTPAPWLTRKNRTLLVAQALDGIELGGASGWDRAENHSDHRRHDNRDNGG
jgi:hypothetical protein